MPRGGSKPESTNISGKSVDSNQTMATMATMAASQRSTRRSNGKRGEKRLRRSTGGSSVTMPINANSRHENANDSDFNSDAEGPITIVQYKSMSTDDKLVTLFGLMSHVHDMTTKVYLNEKTIHDEIRYTDENTRRIKTLEYKSIDLEARSRRNNLVIRGIQETREEICESKVLSFIHEHLQLDQTKFVVQRAHRIGKPGNGKNRPLIVCFRDYISVTEVLKNAHKLRGTNYSISKDFPIEIATARTKLWPLYKQARRENPRGPVKLEYPARLRVNGRVTHDEFPDWSDVMSGHRTGPVVYDRRSSGSSEAKEGTNHGSTKGKHHSAPTRPVTLDNPSLNAYLEDTVSGTDTEGSDEDSTDSDSYVISDSQPVLDPPRDVASGVTSGNKDTSDTPAAK